MFEWIRTNYSFAVKFVWIALHEIIFCGSDTIADSYTHSGSVQYGPSRIPVELGVHCCRFGKGGTRCCYC